MGLFKKIHFILSEIIFLEYSGLLLVKVCKKWQEILIGFFSLDGHFNKTIYMKQIIEAILCIGPLSTGNSIVIS